MAIQTDGKIVVAGTSNATGASDFAAVRYNTDGSLDNSFGTAGITTVDIGFGGAGSTDQAHSLSIQSDGKIVLAGQTAASTGGNDDVAVIRLTSNGTLDSGPSGFDSDGIVTFNYGPTNTDEEVRSVYVQSDGSILVGGSTDGTGSSFSLLMLRYTSTGSLDPTFGASANGIATADITGSADIGYAMTLYGTHIYVAGSTGDNSAKEVIVAAFNNSYNTLPLTLLQFYAEKQTSKVVLHWQTNDEKNVNQFIVETSSDGKNFKTIAHVIATGNSSTTKNYSYTDQLPLYGNNYYRLLMQDVDDSYKYSKVVKVNFGEKFSRNMQLYPCPVKDIVHIQVPGGLYGTIGLRIIDLYGHVVKTNNVTCDGNALSTSLDLRYLPNGVYIFKAQAGNTLITHSFIKQ
jgi:uncharacterized delta-60 repeat protein